MRLRYLVVCLNVMKPNLSCVVLNPLVGGPEVSVFQANPGVTHVVFPGVNRLSHGAHLRPSCLAVEKTWPFVVRMQKIGLTITS